MTGRNGDPGPPHRPLRPGEAERLKNQVILGPKEGGGGGSGGSGGGSPGCWLVLAQIVIALVAIAGVMSS
jgi:hypothetical protein